MKAIVITILIFTIFAPAGFAQQSQSPKEDKAALRRGSLMMGIGAALVGAGVLMVPVTDTKASFRRDRSVMFAGLGSVATGSVLLWLGASDRRRVVQPQTTVGVTVGDHKGLQVRRTW
jgi:hypothetical protein